jgi:hypothetical protein
MAAGLAPATDAYAFTPSSKTSTLNEKISFQEANQDFNDWFDGLAEKQQDTIEDGLNRFLKQYSTSDCELTAKEAHALYRTLAKYWLKNLNKADAKELLQQDFMTPVRLAAVWTDTIDWIDAVENSDVDYDTDDLQACEDDGMSDCEAGLGLAGMAVGGVAGFWASGGVGTLVGAEVGYFASGFIADAVCSDDGGNNDNDDSNNNDENSDESVSDGSTSNECPN